MSKTKISFLALVASFSAVTMICGCGDSNTAPKPQQVEGGATQTVSAAASAAVPTGTVAEAAKPRQVAEPAEETVVDGVSNKE